MIDKPQKTGVSVRKRVMPKGKPFVKGYDPRRNISGVPKSAIEARKHVREIFAELLKLKDDYGEGEVTRLYAMLRTMSSSRNPRDRELLLKAAFPGLLKDEVDVTSNGETIQPKVDDERFDRAISSLADAIRESLPGKGAKPDGALDTAK